MLFLLAIADDLTGALDTGVQFASAGLKTRVVIDPMIDLASIEEDVLIIDTETRHLTPQKAYDIVYQLVIRAKAQDIPYLYKKTDSALRGNIGSELAAVLNGSGCSQLTFLPAYPQMGRVTNKGVHFVNGVPVDQSPFGKDLFEPVKYSYIPKLITEQWPVEVKSFKALTKTAPFPKDEGILVFDAISDKELFDTGEKIVADKSLKIMAGCAGFGNVFSELLAVKNKPQPKKYVLDPRLLVVCGSVNPITLAQINFAQDHGFARFRLSVKQKLKNNYWNSSAGTQDLQDITTALSLSEKFIIETNDLAENQLTINYAKQNGMDLEKIRVQISSSLGQLVSKLFSSADIGTIFLIGGDTLLQVMLAIGVKELVPICELEPGVVLAHFTLNGVDHQLVAKSGGFGKPTLLSDIATQLLRNT